MTARVQARRMLAGACAALATAAAAAAPASAAAPGSIVYSRGSSLWIMRGDGSGQQQIPHTGGLSEPTQANDGAILALGPGAVIRINQRGQALSRAVPNPVSASPAPTSPFVGWGNLHGPADPVISPDDQHYAYWGFGQTNRYDVGCNCVTYSLENFVRYGSPVAFNEPSVQGYGQGDAAYPGWLGNGMLMMEPIAPGLADEVFYYPLGGAENAEENWFSDPGFNGDTSTNMKEGASSPAGDKLAFVVDYTSASSSATVERLVLYKSNGPPPAVPTQTCAFTASAGTSYSYPTFSPDGNYLAFGEGSGIAIASVANLSDCSTVTAHLVVASGGHPSWGPTPERALKHKRH